MGKYYLNNKLIASASLETIDDLEYDYCGEESCEERYFIIYEDGSSEQISLFECQEDENSELREFLQDTNAWQDKTIKSNEKCEHCNKSLKTEIYNDFGLNLCSSKCLNKQIKIDGGEHV